MRKSRMLRWLVPLGAVGVAVVLASGALTANAKPNLPFKTAAELLASINDSTTAQFSGTVVEKASLGLPELPSLGGSSASTGMLDLLTGSHTARVWYGGETRQRVALLDSLGEQDVFRNDRDLWQYNSNTHTSTHTVLPSDTAKVSPSQLPSLTPREAADAALRLIDPSTNVATDSSGIVAGRATYTLVLTPKDARSLIGSVRVSLDGKTKVPLSVQVVARNSGDTAIDVSFTRVDFSAPDADMFVFRPPANVTSRQSPALTGGRPASGLASPQDATVIGSGWTSIVEVPGVSLSSITGQADNGLGGVLKALPPVSGSWGSGRLFTSAIVSGLITDDGRAFVGAVDPELLYQAAASK